MKVISKTNYWKYLTFIFILFSLALIGQNTNSHIGCGHQSMDYQSLCKIHEELEQNQTISSKSRSANASVSTIPIVFTVFRRDDGTANNHIDQTDIDAILNELDQVFSDFNFIQIGDIRYVNNSVQYAAESVADNFTDFSFVSSVVNFYIRGAAPTASASQPWSGQFNSKLVVGDNRANVGSNGQLTSFRIIAHEMGHILGLEHTFAGLDINPYTQGNQSSSQTNWPNELKIRTLSEGVGKTYPTPNWSTAGDFIQDTPADCNPLEDNDCDVVYTNQSPTYVGMYKDANNDFITPDLSNYMSYYLFTNSFTTGQEDKMDQIYNAYYSNQLDPSRNYDIVDRVEFVGTNIGIPNVGINHSFPTSANNQIQSNSFTNQTGDFVGMNYNPLTFLSARKKVFEGGTIDNSNHDVNDWVNGVSTFDIVLIQKHILGITPFQDGYKKIAADVNQSGSITAFDIVQLRQLILNITESLPSYAEPWVFIPEFIPQDHQTMFNSNPFNSNIANIGWPNYIDEIIVYNMPPAGKRGFDGIKIGDVNNSANPQMQLQQKTSETRAAKTIVKGNVDVINQKEEVELSFEIDNFKEIVSYQMDLNLPMDKFDLIDLDQGDLVGFTKDNFNIDLLKRGTLKTIWVDSLIRGVSMENGKALFKLRLKAKKPVFDLNKSINWNSEGLGKKFFDSDGKEVDVNVVIKVNKINNTKLDKQSLVVYPNPTRNLIKAKLTSSNQEDVLVNIYDSQGRTIYQSTQNVSRGVNEIEIGRSINLPIGVLSLEIITSEGVLNNKVINVK